jgi:hypothetical protein
MAKSKSNHRQPIPMFQGSLGGVPRAYPDLPGPLLVLVDRFNTVMRAYADGQIAKNQASQELALIRHTDHNATMWTIGPSSGRWYARPEGTSHWELADPIRGNILSAQETPDQALLAQDLSS